MIKKKQTGQSFLIWGALFGTLAVILGAFGAHGLEKTLSEHALSRYHTGIAYQFYHVAALLAVGILSPSRDSKWLRFSGYAFIAGIFLFCGSLYAYAISGIRQFGMITPTGGLSFILGWSFLLLHLLANNATTPDSEQKP